MKFFSFPSKFLPLTWISMNFFLALIGLHTFPSFLLLILSFFISWIYLRFIKYEDGLRGDRNETFSFVTFFPEPLHPILQPMSNAVFKLLVKLRLLKPMQPPLDMELGFSFSGRPRRFLAAAPKPMPVTGFAALESERRKALALKAVEDRLRQKSNRA
ncbi:hypothetical protein HMI54_002901 [Coelomomyces lativittatus]|nr:hypothetical protein HMI56_003990 [Coelomomyces lativittatus]KAJ1508812.1 hypothetical protein HMI54_002901 [Coelomomyces lativittatus]